MTVDVRAADVANHLWRSLATAATFPWIANQTAMSLDKDVYNMGDTALLTVNYTGATPTISDSTGHVWTKQSDTGSVAVYNTVV